MRYLAQEIRTRRPASADRTARRQFQATGQPVSRTQASDAAVTSRLPRYEAKCVQRRCFQCGSVITNYTVGLPCSIKPGLLLLNDVIEIGLCLQLWYVLLIWVSWNNSCNWASTTLSHSSHGCGISTIVEVEHAVKCSASDCSETGCNYEQQQPTSLLFTVAVVAKAVVPC